LCRGCVDRAADAEGRSVSLFNTSLSGGFLAQHRDDGSECASVTRSGIVFIDAVAFDAAEARFGGIVVRPRSPQES
jgi:hypothetical protein